MTQTRLGSLIEALFNTVIGLAVSMVANHLVFPAFGFHPSVGQNITISVIYTVISLVRQYILRRWFNARLHSASQRLAKSMETAA
jgi:hypothetical protein